MKISGKIPAVIPKRITAAVFGPVPVSRNRAMGLSERLAAVSSLTSSLEYLTQRKDIAKGGMNDWEVARQYMAGASPLTRRLVDSVGGVRTTTALHVARSAVSVGMLLPGNSRWRGAGSLFLGATSTLLSPRHHYGADGSDQVATLVQLATGGARLVPSPAAKDTLLWYAALQANMAYAISGWVKLFGKSWRDASALSGVMRTRTYGHPGMFRWTQEQPPGDQAAHPQRAGAGMPLPPHLSAGRQADPLHHHQCRGVPCGQRLLHGPGQVRECLPRVPSPGRVHRRSPFPPRCRRARRPCRLRRPRGARRRWGRSGRHRRAAPPAGDGRMAHLPCTDLASRKPAPVRGILTRCRRAAGRRARQWAVVHQ